jgi:hypothetical protein
MEPSQQQAADNGQPLPDSDSLEALLNICTAPPNSQPAIQAAPESDKSASKKISRRPTIEIEAASPVAPSKFIPATTAWSPLTPLDSAGTGVTNNSGSLAQRSLGNIRSPSAESSLNCKSLDSSVDDLRSLLGNYQNQSLVPQGSVLGLFATIDLGKNLLNDLQTIRMSAVWGQPVLRSYLLLFLLERQLHPIFVSLFYMN